MAVLLMRLEGPMQSWGTYSRFTERDAGKEPSKSGVIGLLCAALGRPRDSDLSDLSSMRMSVRADREGALSRDFHTAENVPRAGNPGTSTVISNRFYLSDACFLAVMEGSDDLIAKLKDALRNPRWELFLGRKAFTPSAPVLIEAGDEYRDGRDALYNFGWLGRPGDAHPREIRAVVECGPGEGEIRMDVPISFAQRKFEPRFVRTEWVPMPGPRSEG